MKFLLRLFTCNQKKFVFLSFLISPRIFIVAGVPGVVSASEGDASSIQEGAQLYEDDQATEIPGGIRSGKGH
jgi:hypothetical protein